MTARSLLAVLDDEALATLASRGLLRRAAKDVAAGLVTALDDLPDGGLRAQVDGMAVTIPPAGAAAAVCGCKATGACRHLLAAALACRGDVPAAADPREELAALDLPALHALIGRPALRGALELLDETPAVAITEVPGAVLVDWPGEAHPIRYVAGAGFAGMISRIPPARQPAIHAAAVLAWRRAAGLPLGEVPGLAQRAPSGLSDDERAFLDQTEQVVHDLLRLGLAAVADVSRERVAALAVAARAEHLPRLAASLRSLAAAIDALATRRVEGSSAEALARMARTAALIEALRRASPHALPALRGRHRAAYAPAGSLELVPVIGHRWRARGGSEGVRLLFWAPQRGAWLEWSQPRLERAGIDPAAQFAGLGPWPPLSFAGMAGRSRLLLGAAAIGAGHRLSASGSTVAQGLPGPWWAPEERFAATDFADWLSLRTWMAAQVPVGLSGEEPSPRVAVLRPAAWGQRVFDATRQTLLCPVLDGSGRSLILAVPYHAVTATRIQVLDSLPDALLSGAAVVCGLSVSAEDWWMEPLGLVRADEPRVVHLDFPPPELAGAPSHRAPAAPPADRQPAPLRPYQEALRAIAEAGLSGGIGDSLRQRCAALNGQALDNGLARPASLLARLACGAAEPSTILALSWQLEVLRGLSLRRMIEARNGWSP